VQFCAEPVPHRLLKQFLCIVDVDQRETVVIRSHTDFKDTDVRNCLRRGITPAGVMSPCGVISTILSLSLTFNAWRQIRAQARCRIQPLRKSPKLPVFEFAGEFQ